MSSQENLNTSNIVKVLVIGETGSGKSTCINYITNYFGNGTLENLKVAIPCEARPHVTEKFQHSENKINDPTHSQTNACHQYLFANNLGQFLFLDTPGLSDTRGPTQDDINIEKITDAVEQLGGLTAVIIVVNGATCRLTLNLKNVIARLRGNMPDVVMDNVIVILTNAKRHEASFKVQALELHGNVYPYYFQNSAFCTEPGKWTQSAKDALRRDWDNSMRELKNMITTIKTFTVKSVTAFTQIKDIRNAIKTLMHAAQVEVSEIQKMQDEIAAFNKALKQVDGNTKMYKKYTEERTVEHIEIVDADYHSTLCQNCNFVCHNGCKLDETTIVGSQIFMRCWAMDTNGTCKKCPHQCNYTAHYHARKMVKRTQRKLQHVLADIKAKYDRATKDKDDIQKKMTTADEAKNLLEKALKQKHAEIKQKCIELRGYCCGFNLAQELSTLISQLEVESRLLKNIDAKLQAEEFIRSLKELCTQLQNDQEANKQNRRPMCLINTATPEDEAVRPRTACQSSSPLQRQLQSADTNSHASSDVLALIRKLNDNDDSKKTNAPGKNKKNKKKQSDEESEEEDPTEKKSDSDVSEQDRHSTHRSKEKRTIKTGRRKADFDVEKFKKMSISELIHEYHSNTDDRLSNSVVHELVLRSRGESQFTLTAAESAGLIRITNQYASLNSAALKQKYKDVTAKIAEKTGPDIIRIEHILPASLLEVRALYELTQTIAETMSDDVAALHQPPPIDARASGSNWERGDQHRNCYLHQPMACNYHPPLQHNPCTCAHCSHYSSSPQQHCMCDSPRQTYSHSHSNIVPPTDRHHFKEDEPPPYETVSTSQQHANGSNRIPSSYSAPDMRNTSRRQASNDVFPDLMNDTNTHVSSSRARTYDIAYGAWSTSALINAYKELSMQHDLQRKVLIKEELEQRCFGNYPTLIAENPSEFEKHYKAHQHESLKELKRNYRALKQLISSRLFNDCTNITEIPETHIIEAAALIKCMAEKEES